MSRVEGFTIVEVLVAGVVIMLVLLAVASMSLTAHSQLGRSGEHTAATALVQQRIEWLRNRDYASSELAAGTVNEALSGTYHGYSRTTVIQDDTPRSGLKQVEVTTVTPSGLSTTGVTLISE